VGAPERAQGGGPRADRIVEAIEKAKKLVREKLEAIGKQVDYAFRMYQVQQEARPLNRREYVQLRRAP